jgi:superfamily II DNA/RNA helicase
LASSGWGNSSAPSALQWERSTATRASARDEVLAAFRRGQLQTLLATNVAARGLDIKGIYQVINYELPESSELFTHRIGRTGRMGQQGKAITLLSPADLPKWRRMARSLGQAVALQRLALNEVATPPTKPEITFTRRSEHDQNEPGHRREPDQENEQGSEQRPGRARKQFAPDQDHREPARAKRTIHAASASRRRKDERMAREAAAWQNNEFAMSERHLSSSRARKGKNAADRRFSAGKNVSKQQAPTAGKRRAAAFAIAEPQRRTARKKAGAKPAARTRGVAASRRVTRR